MKVRKQILRAVLSALLLTCFGTTTEAQQMTDEESPTLSAAMHAALYPEVMCERCIVPKWDRGYLFHIEFDRDPAVVTMYDQVGKKVLEAHMEPPGAAKVIILSAGATQTWARVTASVTTSD
jgi:hypothetical protein